MDLTAMLKPACSAFQRKRTSTGLALTAKLLLIMKLTAILLLAAGLTASAHGHSQKVSLRVKDAPIEEVFRSLKKQTGYNFVYANDVLTQAKPVNLSISNSTLDEVLLLLFKSQPLSYAVVDKVVVVKVSLVSPKENMGDEAVVLPPIDIKGRLTNDRGEPVEGASIRVKGTDKGTSTNANGEFELKGVDENAVLVITGTNIETVEWKVGGKKELVLITKAKEVMGEEVVVSTGYQDIPKERSTGSFYKIDNELLNRKVSTTILDRIIDVSSGLVFTKSVGNNAGLFSSDAGGLPSLQIRGASTINANKFPLTVVDNFPFHGSIDNINPNDIESVTILKDAAAASVWGIQSGNGVIVITTKKGKYNRKTNISINSNISVGQKPDLFYIPTIPSAEIISFERKRFADSIYNEYDDLYPSFNYYPVLSPVIEILLAARAGKITSQQAEDQISALNNQDVRNDINKYFLQNSINQQYALNISGGGNEYRYYSSIGYDENRTEEVGNKSKRLTLRMNNAWSPLKNFEITTEINYIHGLISGKGNSYRNFLPTGNFRPPYTRLVDDQGNSLAIPQIYRLAYVDTASYPALLDWHYRPLDELKYVTFNSEQNDIRFNAVLKYTLFKGLDITAKYQQQITNSSLFENYDQNSFEVRNGINRFMNILGGQITYPWPLGSRISYNNSKFKEWNFRFQINLNRTWGEHTISSLMGSEINENNFSTRGGTLIGFDNELSLAPIVDYITPIPVRPDGSLQSIGTIESYVKNDQTIFRNGSHFANVGYSFKNRYLFTTSARVDQANLFGVKANQRKVPLWSTGLGWIISKEDFYKSRFVNSLKIRVTFGYNGNASSSASALPTITYATQGSPISPITYYALIQTPNNPQLRWERIRMMNFGVDFETFNSRLNGSIEYYNKKGLDLIGQIPADPTSGWSSYIGNFANLITQGVDVILNTRNFNKKFKWNTNLLFSFNCDKVTNYGGQTSLRADDLINGYGVEVGQTLYAFNSYRWAGLRASDGTPQIYLADTVSDFNNYTQGNVTDVVRHGSRSPRFFGNILNTFTWNNVSLSCNITYKFKYFFRRKSYTGTVLMDGLGGHNDYSIRWQKPGDEVSTNVPADGYDNRYMVYGSSNILAERGDHIRLQDIRVSYDLDQQHFKRLPFESLQLYFYAQNLGVIWRANEHRIDPEAFLYGTMPTPKVFSVGLSVTY